MALSDYAASLSDETPWRTSATCHALENMTEDDAATLRRLLADRNVQFAALAGALAADPDSPTIARDALSRHARGLCSAGERLR
jgi:hypothetical protein